MSKLKTIFLLFLAGFIVVGCSDPRAEDKKILVDELMDLEDLTKDQAECAINAFSDNFSDNSWKGLVLEVTGSNEEYNQLIDYIAEQNTSLKLNMFTPSTHVEIIDEKNMIKKQPDYALILSWHYGKNVMKNLRNKGYKGKFIMPLPKPKIIN